MDDSMSLSIIIIAYLALILLNVYIKLLISIKKNWSKYRCHPLALPAAGIFGEDPGKNFEECLASEMSGYMDNFLDPIYANFEQLNELSSDIYEVSTGAQANSGDYQNSMLPGVPTGPTMDMDMDMGGDSSGGMDLDMGDTGIVNTVGNALNNVTLLFNKWGIVLGDTGSKFTGVFAALMNLLSAVPIVGKSIVNNDTVKFMKTLGDMT